MVMTACQGLPHDVGADGCGAALGTGVCETRRIPEEYAHVDSRQVGWEETGAD